MIHLAGCITAAIIVAAVVAIPAATCWAAGLPATWRPRHLRFSARRRARELAAARPGRRFR